MQIKTRNGQDGLVTGPGPLSKTFLQVELSDKTRYLVWASDRRYRMDVDENREPVLHPLDIVEMGGGQPHAKNIQQK